MEQKRITQQYVGRLTPEQAAEGIAAAQDNARSLVRDAVLLLDHGRWPRAAALSILAIEEAGKASVLRALILARDDLECRDGWRAYRSHTQKNAQWILPQLAAQGARHLEDLRRLFDANSEHPHVLDGLKQIALYTDAYSECQWSSPDAAVEEPLARMLVDLARVFASDEPSAMTSAAELALWVKHLKPVWKADMAEMKAALIVCYAEARELDLLKGKNTAADMIKFVR
jgi:AbiV family abortive infection protein